MSTGVGRWAAALALELHGREGTAMVPTNLSDAACFWAPGSHLSYISAAEWGAQLETKSK